MRARSPLLAVSAATAVVMSLSACGASPGGDYSFRAGSALHPSDVDSVVAQVRATGKPAYYLGNAVGDLPLTVLDLVEENAPMFQVEAHYGSCQASGEGGCADPVSVSTTDRPPDVLGTHCQRLEPQLGVPAGVIMGELTVATGDVIVTVSDFRGRDGDNDGIRSALMLLPRLRALGDTGPRTALPPPNSVFAAWMDEVCGTRPGKQVSHDFDNQPVPAVPDHVPGFTVERLGGGELNWADYHGKGVVIAVGTVPQVSTAVRRLQPLVAKAPSHPTLLGLVSDPTGDKFNPRPLTEIERQTGRLPAPVGYAAVPMSALWFLDAASDSGGSARDTGTIAFVDRAGDVVRFAPLSTPDAQLSEWARALG
jgi:hypothetical protein